MRKPDLKLETRVRVHSLGTKHRADDGQMYHYVKWDYGTTKKVKMSGSKLLIVIYYIWFRLLRWRI